jgi:Zn-dependent protease
MRWSWKLGEVAGIGIFVHWTFLILLVWFVTAQIMAGNNWQEAVMGLALVLAVFGCIILHELGHALTAKRYNIRTRDITILPIGGLARLERIPEDPKQELWIALAGPAVNLVIAAVLFAVIGVLGQFRQVFDLELVGGPFLPTLMMINLFLAVFNLLPAFPMDGGRVLRALLAYRLPYVRATEIAASVGQAMAIVFGILGLFTNWFLLFIALFVYIGAQQEAYLAQVRSALRGIPVRDAMITRFRSVSPDDTLELAIDELLAGYQEDFPVVNQGRLIGMLMRQDLLKALSQGGRDTPVRDCMRVDCATVEDAEMLDASYRRMQDQSCSTIPVTRGGQLVGVVTLENVGEFMSIQNALQEASFVHRKPTTPAPITPTDKPFRSESGASV